MLTEDQVAARLHADVDDIQAPMDLAAAVRRRHTRRARALMTMTAVPVAVAVVTVVALVAAPPQRTQPNLRNAAYVADHTVAALDTASERVVHIQGAISGRTLEQWRDPTGSRWRVDETGPDGRARRAMVVTGPDNGTRTVLTVDYTDRAWWTYRLAQPGMPSDVWWIAMFDGPDDIKDALRLWSLHLVGTERVNGQDTVHLGGAKPTGRGIAIDIWVDAATYLPVRIAIVSPDMSVTSQYTWLPRTPQNLAPFDLKPPAGFTQRPR
jgi:hypothetical protein